MLRRRAAGMGIVGAPLWLGCAFAGTGDPPPFRWQVTEIQTVKIREPSGLARSRRHEGVFWTHNDSGDVPRFFAIDANGNLLAEFSVEGASHTDWVSDASSSVASSPAIRTGSSPVRFTRKPSPSASGSTLRCTT